MIFAVDDGLVSGNANLADLFFLAAVICGILAAILSSITPSHRLATVFGWAAVSLIALGFLVL